MVDSVGVDGPAPGGQSYVERPPVAALAGLVSSVWIQQVAPDAEPYTQRTSRTEASSCSAPSAPCRESSGR